MIQFFGQSCLLLAWFFAFCQGVFPIIGFKYDYWHLSATARPAAYAQFIFVALAYGLLTAAFVTSDFSIAYVAQNSHPLLPWMYRLTAVWGAHEGSILLWILLLSLWTLSYSFFSKTNRTLTLGVLGLISFAFLSFLILTSNPFLSAAPNVSGQDLNPLLQDPGFVIHPPMLYTGYVGFSVAFAITLAALIRGQCDAAWAKMTRQFALAAWCFLTFGIALGSWWAYRVLGWGGFWFWDPVENASLLPWLSGTALIHILVLVEKRGQARAYAALLAIITFAMSLLGTFLVRSGILVSAHTFASDPSRGLFLLILLAVLMLGTLIVYVKRIPQLRDPQHLQPELAAAKSDLANKTTGNFPTRELSLRLQSALLLVFLMTILVGTLYPLIIDVLQLGVISVGAPYFNTVLTPLVLVMMAMMAGGALLRWQPMPWFVWFKQAALSLLASSALGILLLLTIVHELHFLPTLSLVLSLWIILSVANAWRTAPGMVLAHSGFALMVIGIMLSSLLAKEHEARMATNDTLSVGPYQFTLLSTAGVAQSNYRGIRADFLVTKGDRIITHLYPEKRIFTVRQMVMTKVDIHPGLFRDLYIALGQPFNEDEWSVRIYYKPFIRFIWLGGLLMMVGGFLSLRPRRTVTEPTCGH